MHRKEKRLAPKKQVPMFAFGLLAATFCVAYLNMAYEPNLSEETDSTGKTVHVQVGSEISRWYPTVNAVDDVQTESRNANTGNSANFRLRMSKIG